MRKFTLLVLMWGIIISLCGCARLDYNTAEKYMNAAEYKMAMELFEQLEQRGGYNDSAEKYLECKYRYVESHISDGNYKLVNEIFGDNLSDNIFKYEVEKTIALLDEKIEKILIDMYNEKADLFEAEELAKLYINLTDANELSSENGEIFKSTVAMYKSLEGMKECIEEGNSFDALGKGLISTPYADVEVFAEVLLRSINESNKNDIVSGVASAVEAYIDRADGNWQFVEIPDLLVEENALSTLILDADDRNMLIGKIEEYNRSRKCNANNCQGWTKSTYCEEHKCEDDECEKMRNQDGDYCNVHTCVVSECSGYRAGVEDSYCYEHECNESDCTKYATNGKYCSNHANSSNGYNYATEYVQTVTCNACNGTGKGSIRYRSDHYKSKLSCDICGGDGKVEK